MFPVSLPPFSCPSCLEYIRPRALILLKTWRYISRLLTYLLTLLKAFTTYVRPLLEYATPVWSPYAVTNITKIEPVQRSFTKRLPGLSNLPYTKRFEFLGIGGSEIRRLRYDLVFIVYKMLFGLADLKFSDYFTLRAGRASCTAQPVA